MLDPGAGAGVLSISLCEELIRRESPPDSIEVEAYEFDPRLARILQEAATYTEEWSEQQGVDVAYKVVQDDFVLTHASALRNARNGDGFDVAIGNPPYFKLPKSDRRAQAASAVVHGQPNIYALFMSISASLLRPGGEIVFITPRSYATGPYFRRFRRMFFSSMKPRTIHLFGSRREAFNHDGVLQENVILHAERNDGWPRKATGAVVVSSTDGTAHLDRSSARTVPIDEVIGLATGDYILRISTTDEEQRVVDVVKSWSATLSSLGLKVSTGPVVPFRTNAITERGQDPTHVPLLWLRHVRPMSIEWPLPMKSKGQYIMVDKDSKPLLVPNKTYVVMRRFSAKEELRRLVAAPLLEGALPGRFVGLENHLNYIHRPFSTITEDEAHGLAALLNSRILDTYFRTSNGNTQVNAAELRAMPLPSASHIKVIGRRVRQGRAGIEGVDKAVEEALAASRTAKPREARALG